MEHASNLIRFRGRWLFSRERPIAVRGPLLLFKDINWYFDVDREYGTAEGLRFISSKDAGAFLSTGLVEILRIPEMKEYAVISELGEITVPQDDSKLEAALPDETASC